MSITPTILLTPDVVLTMDDERSVLEGAAVAVQGDAIVAVGPRADLEAAYPGAARIDLPDRVLMPGLVNAHHHSGMLRGTAEHLPVWEWLRLHIDPMHREIGRAHV